MQMFGKQRVCNSDFLQKKETCKCNADCWLVKLGWLSGFLQKSRNYKSEKVKKDAFNASVMQTNRLQFRFFARKTRANAIQTVGCKSWVGNVVSAENCIYQADEAPKMHLLHTCCKQRICKSWAGGRRGHKENTSCESDLLRWNTQVAPTLPLACLQVL